MLFLSVCSKCSLACYSSSGATHWEGTKKPRPPQLDLMMSSDEIPESQNVSQIKNHFGRISKVSWGGWTPSPEVLTDWKKWVTAYETTNNDTDFMKPEEKEMLDRERKGTGWPADWLGNG
ncbi:unnamed protein product [Chrysodeixis includens]|uniref:Uncharacterized protein n=1 Tax=Chrysodeixis includens TaxID=689277 RepID=A0A9N8L3Y0_CHRIL|nr:unnamed protein product [Chrysodeixis includens]